MTETDSSRIQIVISGVGGQGVLFVTRLLAEAAIARQMHVLTSETHGMAQRGGTVISHLKIGDFASPLIRPGNADGMLALKEENIEAHRGFVRAGGWMVVNTASELAVAENDVHCIDADAEARKIDLPKAVNLVMLGYCLARLDRSTAGLYCTLDDMVRIVDAGSKKDRRLAENSAAALAAGYAAGRPNT
jgi:indolepyruvate ferredoxin oxidoreductase beta subunit